MTNFGQKVKWLKFDQMSRVGSRDRHTGWRSKIWAGGFSFKIGSRPVQMFNPKIYFQSMQFTCAYILT